MPGATPGCARSWRRPLTKPSGRADSRPDGPRAERPSDGPARGPGGHRTRGTNRPAPPRGPYGWPLDPADPARLAEDAGEQAVIVRMQQERRKGAGYREIA